MNTTKIIMFPVAIATILAVSQTTSIAQQVVTPHSGIEKPEDVGVKSHTTFQILVPKGFPKLDETKSKNPSTGKSVESDVPPPRHSPAAPLAPLK